MASTLQTLVNRTRRYLRDWPDQDALTASVTSGATTLNVADTTLYFVNEVIETDTEAMIVRALPSGTSLTVKRGAFGSTAASHANTTSVLIRPRFSAVEIIDSLNTGIDNCFPLLYRETALEYTGILTDVYEYTIPIDSALGLAIPYITRIELKEPGDLAFREQRAWELHRGASPYIKFRRMPIPNSTIRIVGYGPFPHLVNLTDTLDGGWPYHAEPLPVWFAASELLMSGESYRARTDVGAIDNREQATKPGSSMAASQALLQRFYAVLSKVAMPPLYKTVKAII